MPCHSCTHAVGRAGTFACGDALGTRGPYDLPDNYKVSVQVTVTGSGTATLQIDLPIANTGE